ncbi:MAG: UDP-4-amino-4,6-dideoxy-N-acetyl-beta-L-altrosamine transaminase [Bacteroidota bacterium]
MGKVYSYGRQTIGDDDIREVTNVLRADFLTQGPAVGVFEQGLAETLKSHHACAVSSGTAALHLASLALGWKPGDLVITSPLTFLASANCILYAGATPDFVDIDSTTYTMDVGLLSKKVEDLSRKGKSIKAVVAVDYAGQPCDWKGLRTLADKHGFQLVNDSCHALGAAYEGDTGYAVRYADVAILSFHPVKHITTGEGGAVLTMREDLDARLRIFRNHGMTKDPNRLERNDGPWYYEMQELGFNYRITDIQCALGTSQLRKLAGNLEARRRIALSYDKLFGSDSRFITPRTASYATHAYHLYPLQINVSKVPRSKREIFEDLRQNGINCQVHYIPVHLQPYYRRKFGWKAGDFPLAEEFYAREISIPMYPGLTEQDVSFIAGRIMRAVGEV